MKKAIIGAGGCAYDILAQMYSDDFVDVDMVCFVEDFYFPERPYIDIGTNRMPVKPLSQFDPDKYEVLIAIADPAVRWRIVGSLPKETRYFSFIASTATLIGDVEVGEGSVICAGCILTTGIKIGEHSQLNCNTTIGHCTICGVYLTTSPGVNISGDCLIRDLVYIGANASIREKVYICSDVVIGMNAGVVKDIRVPGTYVGTPAKLLQR